MQRKLLINQSINTFMLGNILHVKLQTLDDRQKSKQRGKTGESSI